MSSWHAEAQRLRKLGMPLKEIAATLGKSYDATRNACSLFKVNGVRHASVRHTDGSLTKPHKPRAIPPKIDPMPACVRYVAGEIDRAQLVRELRGQG